MSTRWVFNTKYWYSSDVGKGVGDVEKMDCYVYLFTYSKI